GERRLRPWRLVVRAESKVRVQGPRVHDLARVHLPVRVPDRLELAEGLDQIGSEHLREQLAARLAVAVLAGERAAVADDDVGRALDELAVALDAAAAHEVEVDAAMDEALAEVAVEGRLIVELVHQAPEVPEVVAHAVRRGRRVL